MGNPCQRNSFLQGMYLNKVTKILISWLSVIVIFSWKVAEKPNGEALYDVCDENHPKALPMTFHDIKYSDLIPMRVEKSQVEQIVVMLKSSVSQDCIDMITAWKNGRMR